jgi:5-formyltetrahydrofolate cyclo-ligase
LVTDKQSLRNHYLQIRKDLSSFDSFIKSWTIQNYLLAADFFLNSKVVGLYYPILNEVQTFRILESSLLLAKTVCLPAVVEQKILFYRYNPTLGLKIGKYNIMEPTPTNSETNNQLDMIVIPGVVFDSAGNRIGYGKGYYDRFINLMTEYRPVIAGLGYSFQVHPEEISAFEHDVKLDILITEKGVKYF